MSFNLFSFLSARLMGLITLVSLAMNILLSLVILQKQTHMIIYPLFVEDYNTSDDLFEIMPMDLDNEWFAKTAIENLIKEYIFERMNIIGDQLEMEQRYGDKGLFGGFDYPVSKLFLMSVDNSNLPNFYRTDVWEKFIQNKDTAQIPEMAATGMNTAEVKIHSIENLGKNNWRVDLTRWYFNGTTQLVPVRYTIELKISLKGVRPEIASTLPAALVFLFEVVDWKEEKEVKL